MKTRFLTLGIALICLLAFTACNEKKAVTTDDATDENESVLETSDSTTTEITEDSDEPIADSDEDSDDWENEVWTCFGGTYFFFGDGQSYVVDFPLGQDVTTTATLAFGDEELQADVNAKTGLITACDAQGKEVFRGAIYAGGNLLKGTYRGQHIEVWGSGD